MKKMQKTILLIAAGVALLTALAVLALSPSTNVSATPEYQERDLQHCLVCHELAAQLWKEATTGNQPPRLS